MLVFQCLAEKVCIYNKNPLEFFVTRKKVFIWNLLGSFIIIFFVLFGLNISYY